MTEAGNELRNLTECCICLKEFTDPRMLPCIHTFCLGCLKQAFGKTNEGGNSLETKTMPCPLCRKPFDITAEGLDGLPKNFFMEHLMEVTQNLQQSGMLPVACDICQHLYQGNEKTKNATMRCLECLDNFCDLCAQTHSLHKSSRNHHIVKIGDETEEDMRSIARPRSCSLHNQKPLDYYCLQCKKIFCVSCVLENHSTHNCKDVNTLEPEFRQKIGKIASTISTCADEFIPKKMNIEMKKETMLLELAKVERDIKRRQMELKEMIDNQAATLLEELSTLKEKHIKQLENEKEEIVNCHTILKSFETYCSELQSKGSASDICGSADELLTRANELERHHEAFVGRPCRSTDVAFTAGLIFNKNIVGQIQERFSQTENYVVIPGLSDGWSITMDTLVLNLHSPQFIANQKPLPTKMQNGTFAAVYCNTLYVTGLGDNCDEIWKFGSTSVWMKCTFLVQGRADHSAAFIEDVGLLYICGGMENPTGKALDSVEVYDSLTNQCVTVGKLFHCVHSSGNCVPFRSSIYIFGGLGTENGLLNCVQMYDTKQNICTLLSKPKPSSYRLLHAVRIPWKSSVILIGISTCYIFDLETETWQERKRFKTDVYYFGLVLDNERLFVIGGGINEINEADSSYSWKCRDDIRYISLQSVIDDKPVEWKSYAYMGKPGLLEAYGTLAFPCPQ